MFHKRTLGFIVSDRAERKLINGSGIDVGQGINIGLGKFGKNDKHGA